VAKPPVLPTLRGYQRSWLRPDIVAGVTLVAIAVPEQMATSRLANLPAVTGLYAFVAATVVFALVGTSRNLSVGADSTITPVLAAGVGAVAVAGSAQYTALLAVLAMVVGVLLIAVGLLRLGWIADFLSTPVVTGVLAGIAVEIFLRQMPSVLGLAGGGTTTVGRLRKVVHQLGDVNGWAVAIAAGVLAIIFVTERWDRRAPGALIGLVASIAVTAAAGLPSHGLPVVGAVHGGLPSVGMPSVRLADARRLVGTALTVAFICVMQTAATLRSTLIGTAAATELNRDLVALGAGNLAAGLSGSFPVNSSPPRTAVVAAAGGRSQLAGLVAAALTLCVLLFATGLLKDLPQATLGAILIFVATRLFRVKELRSILAVSRFEFMLAVLTLLTVSFIGIEQGVVVAVVLALSQRTRIAARPRDAVLGREPGTDHWIPADVGIPTEQVPGVVVYLLYAPLWYGNSDYVARRIADVIKVAEPVRVFVLDCNGMSDIDYTGARTLARVAEQLTGRGVRVGAARASHVVHHLMKHGGVLEELGARHSYTSVEQAVEELLKEA